MKALILSASPRRNGNSAALARAAATGLAEAGHNANFVYADDILASFLKDCRQCRRTDGECAIGDGFRSVFLDEFLPAEGFVAATPIYWYGMSSQLKAFFDRMFCYIAASYPRSPAVIERMRTKRIGLILSSEETFPTVSAGIVQQVQEYARYTRSTFVGVVHGFGNARGDVERDPRDPLAGARQFGRDFFTRHATDYQIDTPRPARVWG
jgi:multimeric flavodoxin WrbA